jgi:hypothetical protein
MLLNKKTMLLSAVSIMTASISTPHAATVLFSETFEGVDTGYYNASCGGSCTHSIQTGVPLAGGGTGINGADEDWYGARFERPDGGRIDQDIGVQEFGGGNNNGYNGTHVGLIEDDAGLMFRIDTTGFENVTLSFDWRTFRAGSGDRFVAGYFVGDLLNGLSEESAGSRTYDLRNAAHGGTDGDYNWNPINGGNQGDWNELLRNTRSNSWDTESFNLTLASDTSEVWVAFWLDNGEADIGKFDNVVVMGETIVPVPAAVWLFGSGLIGLAGLARRKSRS